MASYSVGRSKHATLAGGVVDTVSFAWEGDAFRIENRAAAGAGDIYFRLDAIDPVALADETYFLGPGESITIMKASNQKEVRLISSAAAPYSVEIYG